jgi:hypothetical protein
MTDRSIRTSIKIGKEREIEHKQKGAKTGLEVNENCEIIVPLALQFRRISGLRLTRIQEMFR